MSTKRPPRKESIEQLIANLNGGNTEKRERALHVLENLSEREIVIEEDNAPDVDVSLIGMETETAWTAAKRHVEGRSSKWLQRFAANMHHMTILEEKKPTELKLFVPPEAPPVPRVKEPEPPQQRLYMVSDIPKFNDVTLQSNFCLTCWQLVVIGPDRITCELCSVAAHRYCIPNIEKFFVPLTSHRTPRLPTSTSTAMPPRRRKPKKQVTFPANELQLNVFTQRRSRHQALTPIAASIPTSSGSTKTNPRPLLTPQPSLMVDEEVDASVRPVEWVCPFCSHEVNLSNDIAEKKLLKYSLDQRKRRAILLLQSLFRMIPVRRKMKQWRRAAVKIQKFHRSRNFRRALIKERTHERRPVRIRIHEIELQVDALRSQFVGIQSTPVLSTENQFKIIGQFGANLLPKNILDGKTEFLNTKNISKRSLILMMIKNSSIGASETDFQYSVKDCDGGPFPPKTIFLTVAVTEIANELTMGEPKQLYRIDMPLKDTSDYETSTTSSSRLHTFESATTTKSNAFPNRYTRLNSMIDTQFSLSSDSVESNAAMRMTMKFIAPRPLILLPGCPANVHISLTLSEVYDWPRAHVVGQTTVKADNWLIWRQVGLSSCVADELPVGNNHTRLQLQIKTDEPDAKRSRPPTRIVSRASSAVHSDIDLRPKTVVGGTIVWSLIPSSFVGTKAGQLLFLPQASISSAKKRCWCVFIGGHILVYNHVTDMKPKEMIDLNSCKMMVVENESDLRHQKWFGSSIVRRKVQELIGRKCCGNTTER